jgi:hypothetical protein
LASLQRGGAEGSAAASDADAACAHAWRRYASIAQEAERQREPGDAQAQTAIAAFALQLASCLTGAWPAPHAAAEARPPPPAGGGLPESNAQQVLRGMLGVLPACGVQTWQQLLAVATQRPEPGDDSDDPGSPADEADQQLQPEVAAGAGLAALYSLCFGWGLEPPAEAETTVQAGRRRIALRMNPRVARLNRHAPCRGVRPACICCVDGAAVRTPLESHRV